MPLITLQNDQAVNAVFNQPDYNLDATNYFDQSNLSAVWDSDNDLLKLIYTYNHSDIPPWHKGLPFLYEAVLDPNLIGIIDQNRQFNIYVTDHNGLRMNNEEWHLPVTEHLDENVVRVTGQGYEGNLNEKTFVGPGDGRGVFIHRYGTTNPVATVLEIPLDKDKIADIFTEHSNNFAELNFNVAYYANNKATKPYLYKIKVSDITGGEKLVIPPGSTATLTLNPNAGATNIPKGIELYYGPYEPAKNPKESGWGKNFVFRDLEGVTLSPDDEITIMIRDGNKNNFDAPNSTLKFEGYNPVTIPINTKAEPQNSTLMMPNSYARAAVGIDRTFYVPALNEVYTEDTQIKGKTKNADTRVDVYITNLEKQLSTKTSEDPNAAEYPFTVDVPADHLKKDMIVSARATEKGEFPSKLVTTQVKARVTFDLNVPLDQVSKITFEPENTQSQDVEQGLHTIVAPPHPEKTYEDPAYVPNGMEEEMPADPTWSGHVFLGWNTQEDGRGYTFDKDFGIIRSGTVYAQWATAYDIVFHNVINPDTGENEERITIVSSIKDELNDRLDDRLELYLGQAPEGESFVAWNLLPPETDNRDATTDVTSGTKFSRIVEHLVDSTDDSGKKVLHLYPRNTQQATHSLEFYEMLPKEDMGEDYNFEDTFNAFFGDKNLDKAENLEHFLVGKMTPRVFEEDSFTETENEEQIKQRILLPKVWGKTPQGDPIYYNDVYEIDWEKSEFYNDEYKKNGYDENLEKSYASYVMPDEGTDGSITQHLKAGSNDAVVGYIILVPRTYNIEYRYVEDDEIGEYFTNADHPEVNLPETYTYRTDVIRLPRIEREGYRFLGWRPIAANEQEFPDKDQEFREIRVPFGKLQNKVYEAGYEKLYPIKYIMDGGAFAVGEDGPTLYTKSDSIVIDAVPTRENYTFDGWEMNGVKVPPEGEQYIVRIPEGTTGKITLKALWKGEWEPDAVSSSTMHAVPGPGTEETKAESKAVATMNIPTGMVVGDTITATYQVKTEDGVREVTTGPIEITQQHKNEQYVRIELVDGADLANMWGAPEEGSRVTFTYAKADNSEESFQVPMKYPVNPTELWDTYRSAYAKAYPGQEVTDENYLESDMQPSDESTQLHTLVKKAYDEVIRYRTPGNRVEGDNNLTQFEIDSIRAKLLELLKTPKPTGLAFVKVEGENPVATELRVRTKDGDAPSAGDKITVTYTPAETGIPVEETYIVGQDVQVDTENNWVARELPLVEEGSEITVRLTEKIAGETGADATYKEISDERILFVSQTSATPVGVFGKCDSENNTTEIIVARATPKDLKSVTKCALSVPIRSMSKVRTKTKKMSLSESRPMVRRSRSASMRTER